MNWWARDQSAIRNQQSAIVKGRYTSLRWTAMCIRQAM